jgi:hypothetical protein
MATTAILSRVSVTMRLALAVSKVALREAFAMVAVVLGPVHKAQHSRTHPDRFGGSDDGSNAMVAVHQQAALAGLGMGVGGFNLGLGSPGMAGMLNVLNMAQLAQPNGMNPFGVT